MLWGFFVLFIYFFIYYETASEEEVRPERPKKKKSENCQFLLQASYWFIRCMALILPLIVNVSPGLHDFLINWFCENTVGKGNQFCWLFLISTNLCKCCQALLKRSPIHWKNRFHTWVLALNIFSKGGVGEQSLPPFRHHLEVGVSGGGNGDPSAFQELCLLPLWKIQGRSGSHKWPRVAAHFLISCKHYTWTWWLIGVLWFIPRVSYPWGAALWNPKKSPICLTP